MEVPGPRVIVRAELENGFGPTVSSSQPISSSSRYHRGEASSAELPDLDAAIDRGRQHLFHLQTPRGSWCAELEGDTILESEYILLLAWLDQLDRPEVTKAARYIAQQQRPEGGWALYPGGELDISSSVKAYFALKLTGYDPECEPMKRACQAIVARGGADCVNSFTRFYLALLGQISYEHCPAVMPEIVLLPNWSPVNIYRISSWSRAILVPLAIMWAHRPVRRLADSLGIEELFVLPPEKWPPLRSPVLNRPGASSPGSVSFEYLTATLSDWNAGTCGRYVGGHCEQPSNGCLIGSWIVTDLAPSFLPSCGVLWHLSVWATATTAWKWPIATSSYRH